MRNDFVAAFEETFQEMTQMTTPEAVADQFDTVQRPEHYNSHPSGIEVIEVTRNMGFNLGNAWKYVARHKLKGRPKEDLEKALWYIEDEYKVRMAGDGIFFPGIDSRATAFMEGEPDDEAKGVYMYLKLANSGCYKSPLLGARFILLDMIAEYE